MTSHDTSWSSWHVSCLICLILCLNRSIIFGSRSFSGSVGDVGRISWCQAQWSLYDQIYIFPSSELTPPFEFTIFPIHLWTYDFFKPTNELTHYSILLRAYCYSEDMKWGSDLTVKQLCHEPETRVYKRLAEDDLYLITMNVIKRRRECVMRFINTLID